MTDQQYNIVDQYAGDRLRRRRMALGLNHPALARAVGSTCQQIAKFESGQDSPSAGVLYELAIALGVRPEYFFADMPNDVIMAAAPPRLKGSSKPASTRAKSQT